MRTPRILSIHTRFKKYNRIKPFRESIVTPLDMRWCHKLALFMIRDDLRIWSQIRAKPVFDLELAVLRIK